MTVRRYMSVIFIVLAPTLLFLQESDQSSIRHFPGPLLAAWHGGLGWLKETVKKNPNIVQETDRLGRTPLHYAAMGDNPKIAEFLISKGADVEARAQKFDGKTPLHTAAAHGALSVAKILVYHGADVNAREEGFRPSDPRYIGRSVLSAATWSGNVELVKWLLDKGAKIVYGHGKTRDTALHSAVFNVAYDHYPKATLRIIDLLAENTGNINVRDRWERTPLHIAAHTGAVATVRHLLEDYPDIKINAEDYGGETPLDYAKDSGRAFFVKPEVRTTMIHLLLKHGARSGIATGEERQTMDDALKPVEARKPSIVKGA